MWRIIWIAALTAIFLFYTVFFIQLGTIWFFNLEATKELAFIFVFLVFTLWTHEKIARHFNSRLQVGWSDSVKTTIETIVVIGVSMLYTTLFMFIPQYLFIPTVEFTGQGIRLTLVVTAFVSLFIYYLVERGRARNELQMELLRSEQLQKENFKSQVESLKAQIDPHFLFNSLNILGSLIYKSPVQAIQFLKQLSQVYRILLDSGRNNVVSLEREMELVDSYIFLMKTRFENSIEFQKDIPSSNIERCLPPASVQTLVENAIKHNTFTIDEPLVIQIRVKDDHLAVSNNIQPKFVKEISTGVGLQNLRNRYRLLSREKVEISQTAEKFTVKLPLLEKEQNGSSNSRR